MASSTTPELKINGKSNEEKSSTKHNGNTYPLPAVKYPGTMVELNL